MDAMDKPKAIILRQTTPASTTTSNTALTFQNGFYTVKPATAGSMGTPSMSMAAWSIPGVQLPGEYVRLPTPSIPISVVEMRNELSAVQTELKKHLHSHALYNHKINLVGKQYYGAPEDIERIKVDCKNLEGRIAKLKSRQDELIKAVREALVPVGNKLPFSKVKRSDISTNSMLYNKGKQVFRLATPADPASPSTKPAPPATAPPPTETPDISATSTLLPSTSPSDNLVPNSAAPVQGFSASSSASTPAVPIVVLPKPPCLTKMTIAPTSTTTATEHSTSLTSSRVFTAALPPLTRGGGSHVPSTSQQHQAERQSMHAGEVIEIPADDDGDDDEIEILMMPARQQSTATKSSCKPHLLIKPVSMSPVPPPTSRADAKYSSIQESHLSAICKVKSNVAEDPDTQKCEDFMTSLDLVSSQVATLLNRRRSERKRITSSRYEFTLTRSKRPNEYLSSLTNSMAAKRPRRSNRTSPVPPVQKPKPVPTPQPAVPISDDEGSLHDDYCAVCSLSGELLLCDTCTLVYHITCVGLGTVPAGKWSCPKCIAHSKQIESIAHSKQSESTSTARPVTVKSVKSTAISAVQSFVRTKAKKDEERLKLLRRNTELMNATTSLKQQLDGMKVILEARLKQSAALKDQNQTARFVFQQMVEMVKAVKKLSR